MKFLLNLLLLSLLWSCSNTKKLDYSKVDKIVYHFEDSSTPPKYHRSYTITFTSEKILTEVDVYGEVIARKEVAYSQEKFDYLLQQIKANEIAEKPEKRGDGCDGGKGDSFRLIDSEGEPLLDVYRYRCGGEDNGNLSGDMDKLKAVITAQEPELKKLLATEYDD